MTDIIRNALASSRKVPVILDSFNKTWILSTEFKKIPKYEHLSTGSPVVPCGRTKPTAPFRNFGNMTPDSFVCMQWCHRIIVHVVDATTDVSCLLQRHYTCSDSHDSVKHGGKARTVASCQLDSIVIGLKLTASMSFWQKLQTKTWSAVQIVDY